MHGNTTDSLHFSNCHFDDILHHDIMVKKDFTNFESIHVCMYVHVIVVHVCMHVCMCVCMYEYMHVCTKCVYMLERDTYDSHVHSLNVSHSSKYSIPPIP